MALEAEQLWRSREEKQRSFLRGERMTGTRHIYRLGRIPGRPPTAACINHIPGTQMCASPPLHLCCMLKPLHCEAPRREAALDEAERAEPHQHGGAQGGRRLVPGTAAV